MFVGPILFVLIILFVLLASWGVYRTKPAPADGVVLPGLNSVWQHSSGRCYRVLHIANRPNEKRYPLTIVYLGTDGQIWTRRADDWHRSMTPFSQLEQPRPEDTPLA